jgi:hypothetical protein
MLTKTCNGPCGRKLELEWFHKDAKLRSGYRGRCKLCTSKKKWPSVAAFDAGLYDDHLGGLPMPEGRAPLHGGAPDGYLTRGRSTLYNKRGEIIAEWVKTAKDKEDEYKAIMEAIKGIADDWVKPKAIQKPKGFLEDDLLTVIPLGDPHFGMFSWAQETGQDFDLNIAEANLVAAVDHLVALAPKAKNALLINLGDFFHADNASNQTTHGTRVDVDTRWSKVLRVGIRAMRRCIDRLLEKHEKVTVICEIGNHDSHSAQMLALALEAFYENEPRVEIDTSPAKFHWYRFGKNLLGVTHGDTVKAKDLPGVMACDRARDWGETEYRYWYTGHVHHDTVKEYPGVIVETFRTLAPADAWHKNQGYRSGQDLKLDVIHKKYGRVNRHVIGIRQIWDK